MIHTQLNNMDAIATLPGFRFYPTEEELVSFYLHHKLRGTRLEEIDTLIPLLDIYQYNPWDLPLGLESEQWFFFSRREARGGRPSRLTSEGYWKATGSPGDVYSSLNGGVIGRKRTMVFYVGRAPNGTKTPWKMNEYLPIHSPPNPQPQLSQELSLCRIYKNSRSLRAFDRRPPPPPPPPEAAPTNVVNPIFHHESLENESDGDYDHSFHV